ncbi:MAG: hypothetical protein HY880_00100 [Deltaproteobacteria bacterium]|nr:hypothetical protein [Deltaproteobacteria bacterium]
MANDMGVWAHDIVDAHKLREAVLSTIRFETCQMLEGFRKERKQDAAAWHGILGRLHSKTKKEHGHCRGKKSEKSSSD